jgi:hypothetical protein
MSMPIRLEKRDLERQRCSSLSKCVGPEPIGHLLVQFLSLLSVNRTICKPVQGQNISTPVMLRMGHGTEANDCTLYLVLLLLWDMGLNANDCFFLQISGPGTSCVVEVYEEEAPTLPSSCHSN